MQSVSSIALLPRAAIRGETRAAAVLAAVVWIALLLPPLRRWFEASMFRHMILQLPLLMIIGWVWGKWLADNTGSAVARWVSRFQLANRWGATGLLIAIATMTIWMLPRALDSARLDLTWALGKFLSVSVLAGIAAAWSWHRCPAIARGVIHMEIVATFWRFGWVFLATEERLCLTYLLGDQQRTGTALCCIGVMWSLAAVWRPLFGSANTKAIYVS
jgi:hypothetical protein